MRSEHLSWYTNVDFQALLKRVVVRGITPSKQQQRRSSPLKRPSAISRLFLRISEIGLSAKTSQGAPNLKHNHSPNAPGKFHNPTTHKSQLTDKSSQTCLGKRSKYEWRRQGGGKEEEEEEEEEERKKKT